MKVLRINGMRSAAAERAQDRVETNADALRHFRKVYGLPEATARKALKRCMARTCGVCLVTPRRRRLASLSRTARQARR